MARIRSIKPEFPQSESMGRVSRDARLTFLELWTLADDEGRLRGNSRMLASLLFPYDDDAPNLIDTWLDELERERCIVRYKSDGQTYIEITNWLIHQKIDKPSKSKIPPFANVREDSRNVVVGRDQGRDQGEEGIREPKQQRATRLPADWMPGESDFEFAAKERPDLNPEAVAQRFRDYWHGIAGQKGTKLDWSATWRNWVRNEKAGAANSAAKPRGLVL